MKRSDALDSLRGLTIGMMVLCGTIITATFNPDGSLTQVLPDWMAHCQVPPGKDFDPSIYGITWVDLVFPFFLFSMGAAMPFSVGSRMERGASVLRVIGDAVWRGLKLAYFAIFIQNCYPWIVSGYLEKPADPGIWAFTIAAFMVLFLLFMRWPDKVPKTLRRLLPILGICISVGMMWFLESHHKLAPEYLATDPGSWSIFIKHVNNVLHQSNIIILVLANMAAFGAIIYIFTIGRPLARIAILPFLMAILLGASTEGSWQQALYNWSPCTWLYRFEFLKYLFIIIPGTLAGEYLRNWIKRDGEANAAQDGKTAAGNSSTAIVASLSLAVIVVNVILLFGRHLEANLFITALLLLLLNSSSRLLSPGLGVIPRLLKTGAYLLMLGLFFEAFEGGIRKDHSTYSYYFVTAGLACYCLTMLVIICDVYHRRLITKPFTLAGRNPMIAYVATSMFIWPLCQIVGIYKPFAELCEKGWLGGLCHGIVYTSIAIAIAAFFSSKKLYWRT